MEPHVWREHDSLGTFGRSHFLVDSQESGFACFPSFAFTEIDYRCYNCNEKMIQTTPLRIITLWILVILGVTAEDDTPPSSSIHRQALRQKCSRTCPFRMPVPGGSCCYTGTDDCNYDYVYMWDFWCESIHCVPVTTCECGPDPRNVNRRAWNCAMQRRRELAAMECNVTEETANLALSVGSSCTPSP